MSGASGRLGRRQWLFALLTALLVLVSLEVMSRAYWAFSHRVGFFDSLELEHSFYRELRFVERQDIDRDDGILDVLLLGASPLHSSYGDVPGALERAMEERVDGPYRIHNLAVPGHTSRDSLNKYRRLRDKHFDVVVIYHSINEIRANNAPPDRFREDYAHMKWYREANAVMGHDVLARIWTLPFTLQEAWLTVLDASGMRPEIGMGRPLRQYIDEGSQIRSAAPFEHNLREILAIARERGEPTILGRYAWYPAPGYEYARFADKQLDYRYERRYVPIEVWGHAENVLRGLEVHDRVLQRIAESQAATRLLDVQAAIPHEGRYWSDVCHFSTEGSERFAALLADAIVETASGAGGVPDR